MSEEKNNGAELPVVPADPSTPGAPVIPGAVYRGPVQHRAPFRMRGMVLFPAGAIHAGEKYPIVIAPREDRGDARVERIVMHRSIATKLILEAVTHNGVVLMRGSGSCEVFLAENVPNWSPEGVIITAKTPLVIHVFNPAEPAPMLRPLRIIGNAVVLYRGEVSQ